MSLASRVVARYQARLADHHPSLDVFRVHGDRDMSTLELNQALGELDKELDHMERNYPDLHDALDELDNEREKLIKAIQSKPRNLSVGELKKEEPDVYKALAFAIFQHGQLSDEDLSNGKVLRLPNGAGYQASFPRGVTFVWAPNHGWKVRR